MKKLLLILALTGGQLCFSQEAASLKIKENKPIELVSELPKDKAESYNTAFSKFIAALKMSDRKAINDLISDKVKDIVTDHMIKRLSETIDLKKQTEIYKTGYQSLIDGNYPAIQYKYSDEKSVPPKELITVVFEENGKILGVKPTEK